MLYSCTTFFSKYASTQEFLSLPYIGGILGAFGIMGVYALLWQQVIKRTPIGEAFLFKGTVLIWTMLICYFFFNEPITVCNLIGILLVCTGITIYAES